MTGNRPTPEGDKVEPPATWEEVGIEEHHRCFGLGGYFMAAVLAAASYSRISFSLCLAVRARRVRVPGGSVFHLKPGIIHPCWNLTCT